MHSAVAVRTVELQAGGEGLVEPEACGDGSGVGQAGGLQQHVVKAATPPLHQPLQRRHSRVPIQVIMGMGRGSV